MWKSFSKPRFFCTHLRAFANSFLWFFVRIGVFALFVILVKTKSLRSFFFAVFFYLRKTSGCTKVKMYEVLMLVYLISSHISHLIYRWCCCRFYSSPLIIRCVFYLSVIRKLCTCICENSLPAKYSQMVLTGSMSTFKNTKKVRASTPLLFQTIEAEAVLRLCYSSCFYFHHRFLNQVKAKHIIQVEAKWTKKPNNE